MLADIDSANFNGGSLTIGFTANGTSADQLTIQNQGTGAGQIGISGSNVTYGGTTIGTFTGGANGSDLVVTFNNASATPAAAQALADHILYANTSDDPSTAPRTVTFTVNDGGSDTGTATATIDVTAVPVDHWTSSSGGNWTTASDWSSGVPSSTTNAALDATGTYTVTSSGNVTVNSLSGASTATLDVTGGTFTVTSFTGGGPLILAGGTFGIGSSTATVASLSESGGTLSGLGALTVTGTTSFSGSSSDTGSSPTTSKIVAQSGASFVGGETLTLSAVTLELQNTSATTGSNNLNDLINLNSGALLQLDAGATFNDATTTGGANALLIQSTSGTAGSVSNLGTWKKTGNSSGNDKIVVAFSSTGTDAGHLATVNVAAGTLNLAGNGADTFTSYTGAGTIQFSGTTRTIDVNSSITANAMFSAGTTTVNGTYNAASTTVNGGTANLDGTITGLGAASISSARSTSTARRRRQRACRSLAGH